MTEREITSTPQARLASRNEIKQVIDLMLSGVNSDPIGIEELTHGWIKRTFFQHIAAPRLLRVQMDTMVVTDAGKVIGYLIVQYQGDTSGTFDWGVVPALAGERTALLAALIDASLAMASERGFYPYFQFGLMPGQTEANEALTEAGFQLLDYQLVQVVGALPMSVSVEHKTNVVLVPRLNARFKKELPEFVELDYSEEYPLIDAAAAVNTSLLGNAQLFEVQENSEGVGVIQQSRYGDEARFLYALDMELWNSDLERQIVATMVGPLAFRARRVRIRTFSRSHLEASRAMLESMGLSWEEALWNRWVKVLPASE